MRIGCSLGTSKKEHYLLLVLLTFNNENAVTHYVAHSATKLFWFLVNGGVHQEMIYCL